MENKYLLYIDILGFTETIKDLSKTEEIFEIIDSLNVHQHNGFKTIVFSDTILVYNFLDPKSQSDREYIIMYSCEFAQDLMYRTIGRDVYFRGILTYGEFNHHKFKNIEGFYGKALVDSYIKEKSINCCGLFIDSECDKFNRIFPTIHYDSDLNFVYLNQSLDRFQNTIGCHLPVDSFFLTEIDDYYRIIWDVKLLKDIYYLMNNHSDAKVRTKYLETWHLYKKRYPKILDSLEKGDFEYSVICNDNAWIKKANKLEKSIME